MTIYNKKILLIPLFMVILLLVTACGESSPSTEYTATFTTDSYSSITVYTDDTLSSGSTASSTAVINSSGETTMDGTGSVYFSVVLEDDYELNDVVVTPSSNYASLVVLSDLTYQITNITGDVVVTVTTSSVNTGNTDTDPLVATFVLDDNVTVTVYDTQDYTDGVITTSAYAKDADTGEILTDGEGQVNFTVNVSEGYEIDNVLVTPSSNYNNLKDPEELELENTYRVTKIEDDITITITTKLIGTASEVTEFTGTFVLDDNVTVTIYDTQMLENGVETTTAYAKDGDTGELLVDGSGQINFVVTLTEGYAIDSINIEPGDSYANVKTPADLETDNAYRITKITSDITITITTRLQDVNYDDTAPTIINLSDNDITIDNNNGGVLIVNGVVTISYSGDYEVTGDISEGSIVVSASDYAAINLLLHDLSITSSETAPINIQNADNVDITIENTVTLTDNRSTDITETEDTPNAALYSAVDLDIDGTGTLYVYGNYNNGIGSKDDLQIEDITVTVIAANNGLKGSDSLTIESGTLDITAQTGDGLKSSNSDISDKGNQRGIITINGGNITINAASDGIDAAYNVVINNDPTITIYTSESYATGVGEATSETPSDDVIYLKISSSIDTSYRYAMYFTDDSSNSIWIDAEYYISGYVDGRLYYFYTVELQDGYNYYALYQFTSTQTNSTTSYVAKTDTGTINAYYDTIYVSSRYISGTTISESWTMFTTTSSSGDMLGYSTKGIKADNAIEISGGTIVIYAYDDGIHANSDTLLETGVYGTGDVTINGGTITITTHDDGVHADHQLSVNDGTLYVLTSYEGLEANIISISNGTISVNATDDGLNATRVSTTPQIIITGGYVDITVGTGDTDAIDSNGSYTQTGGFVISRSGLTGGMGGVLDVDGTASMSGGTFIGMGITERMPTTNGVLSTGILNITVSSGTYTVEDDGEAIMTFTASTTYARLFIISDLFESGNSYQLLRGTTSIRTLSF